MKLIIAQIVKLIVEFIQNWFTKFKLKELEKAANTAKEKSDESTKVVTDEYSKFMSDYDAWVNEWESKSRRMSEPIDDLPKPSSKAATDDSGPRRNNTKAGRTDKRTKRGSKKRTKSSKKR